MLCHMTMARREVLVQLEDELVDRLDRLAHAEGTSRSDLLRRGAAAVLEAAEQLKADGELRDAYRRIPHLLRAPEGSQGRPPLSGSAEPDRRCGLCFSAGRIAVVVLDAEGLLQAGEAGFEPLDGAGELVQAAGARGAG